MLPNFDTLFSFDNLQDHYIIEEKGKETCSIGMPIKDKSSCSKACEDLNIPIDYLEDGKTCHKNSKNQCEQSEKYGKRASFICKSSSK